MVVDEGVLRNTHGATRPRVRKTGRRPVLETAAGSVSHQVAYSGTGFVRGSRFYSSGQKMLDVRSIVDIPLDMLAPPPGGPTPRDDGSGFTLVASRLQDGIDHQWERREANGGQGARMDVILRR